MLRPASWITPLWPISASLSATAHHLLVLPISVVNAAWRVLYLGQPAPQGGCPANEAVLKAQQNHNEGKPILEAL